MISVTTSINLKRFHKQALAVKNFLLFLFLLELLFFKIFFDCAITAVQFPPALFLSVLHTPSPPHSTPLVHVHGSYIKVLWLLHFLYYSYLTRSILYLPLTLLIPCTFSPSLCTPPPITLHVISISVILFLS